MLRMIQFIELRFMIQFRKKIYGKIQIFVKK